jgi:hypothetical protein
MARPFRPREGELAPPGWMASRPRVIIRSRTCVRTSTCSAAAGGGPSSVTGGVEQPEGHTSKVARCRRLQRRLFAPRVGGSCPSLTHCASAPSLLASGCILDLERPALRGGSHAPGHGPRTTQRRREGAFVCSVVPRAPPLIDGASATARLGATHTVPARGDRPLSPLTTAGRMSATVNMRVLSLLTQPGGAVFDIARLCRGPLRRLPGHRRLEQDCEPRQ